jgi:rubrerythrin
MTQQHGIDTVEDLLAHALAIEREAAERYADLADQMEVHHNHEVAELFRKLAEIEGKHVASVEALRGERELPHVAPWDYAWNDPQSPEAPTLDETHYLMTPYQALSLALAGERRAAEFFERVARVAEDNAVVHLARQMHQEEREHVELVEAWLARYPKPEEGWDEDLDPPAAHE